MSQTEQPTEEGQDKKRREWLQFMQRDAPQPNLFVLKGSNIKITYSSTSFSGEPQITYEDAAGAQHFAGDQIRQLDSEIGRQITFSIGRGLTITVLIPVFHLNLQGDDIAFTTLVITTVSCSPNEELPGRFHSPLGVLQTYKVDGLEGVAQKVFF